MGVDHKKTILNINEKVRKCRLGDICSPKNCRVFGSVLVNDKITPESEIILDTGACFSVISEKFLNQVAPNCKIIISVMIYTEGLAFCTIHKYVN